MRQLKGFADNSDTKIGCFDLWKRVFLDSQMKDISTYSKYRDHNLYSSGNALFSGRDMVTFFYTIDGYPKELDIDFRKALRQDATGQTKVSFISVLENTEIDWGSAQIRSKLRTWKSIDEDSENTVDEFNYRENINLMDMNVWRKQSLLYLSDADIRRKRNLFKFRTMMIISGVRGEEFDTSVRNILRSCKSYGVSVTRISKDLGEYLKAFSPFSLEIGNKVMGRVGNTTLTDELLARFSSYEQGKVGKRGQYWGIDIYSGYAVFKEVKKNSVDAENVLVTGETGSGKSFFMKGLLLPLLADPRFTGTINDIEGFEYIPLASYVAQDNKVILLNMAEGQGKYYDPVEIVLTGDEELDRNMFSFSKSYIIAVLKTLVGKDVVEENKWVSVIINNAVSKTYAKYGITSDMSTWGNSKGLTLFDVYANAKSLYTEVLENKVNVNSDISQNYKYNPGYRDALDLVIAKLSAYFETLENGGTRSEVFKEKVSLNDIKDAKLVVCSFGMAGKSPDMVDPIQMALTQLSAANISFLRSLFAQSRGKYNFKVWEEFQRWGQFPDSEKTIITALTGGRKLGDVNYIVTNKVQELLDSDKFGIFGNTTSFAIGAIDDSKTRQELCERLSMPLLKPDLDKLVTQKGDNESFAGNEEMTSRYDKAFLVRLDKSVTTLTRMELPNEVAKSKIFRTGDMSQMKVLEE